MTRSSDHWLTNAAKGADTAEFDLDDEARDLVARASEAVGGGLLGVDLMETGVEARSASDESSGDEPRDGEATGYTVHEDNHNVEFKALDGVVDADVPARVVDWLEAKVEREQGVTA